MITAATDAGRAPPLGLGAKVLYAVGGAAANLKHRAISSFLVIFYNQVIGLPPQLVGGVLMVALVFDAILDPLVGQISDNLRSRWGRRHPFMLLSAAPYAIAFFLLWNPPEGWSDGALAIYLAICLFSVRFFDTFFKAFPDLRSLGGVRIAAVGPATSARLAELHLQVDAMPDTFVAAKIADAIERVESVENLRVLLIRPEESPSELGRLLEERGGIVDEVASYRTVPETMDPKGAAASLLDGGADWLTFASGSAVQFFHQRFDLPVVLRKHPGLKTLTIGPETSKALRALGIDPTAEAKVHTIDGMVDTLLKKSAA